MDQIGHAGLHVFLIDFSPLNLRDGRGGGHTLGGAHHLIELLVGHVPAFQILFALQVDGKSYHLNAVFFRQIHRDIRAGIGQKSNFHSVCFVHLQHPHFHSYLVSWPQVSSPSKSHWRSTS